MKKILLFIMLCLFSTAFAQEPKDVIMNPDIPVYHQFKEYSPEHPNEPSILYIKNSSKNDRQAETFFKEAAEKTGRQRYLIHIENQRYAPLVIAPGKIAEIKIPPLRDFSNHTSDTKSFSDSTLPSKDTVVGEDVSFEKEFVTKYIKERLEFESNSQELEQRWGVDGTIYTMSTAPIYDAFNESYYVKNLIKTVKEKGLKRKIDIIDLRPELRADFNHIWVATVLMTDTTTDNSTPQKTTWLIHIQLSKNKYKIKNDDMPLKVSRYAQIMKHN